jgi:hypothetical protein
MRERGLTDVTSVPSRMRSVTAAAAVSVGTAPNHGPSLLVPAVARQDHGAQSHGDGSMPLPPRGETDAVGRGGQPVTPSR